MSGHGLAAAARGHASGNGRPAVYPPSPSGPRAGRPRTIRRQVGRTRMYPPTGGTDHHWS
jgi:hypothetical protein